MFVGRSSLIMSGAGPISGILLKVKSSTEARNGGRCSCEQNGQNVECIHIMFDSSVSDEVKKEGTRFEGWALYDGVS